MFVLFKRREVHWSNAYLFHVHTTRVEEIQFPKAQGTCQSPWKGKKKESCRACVGGSGETSIPVEGGGAWRTPALWKDVKDRQSHNCLLGAGAISPQLYCTHCGYVLYLFVLYSTWRTCLYNCAVDQHLHISDHSSNRRYDEIWLGAWD